MRSSDGREIQMNVIPIYFAEFCSLFLEKPHYFQLLYLNKKSKAGKHFILQNAFDHIYACAWRNIY